MEKKGMKERRMDRIRLESREDYLKAIYLLNQERPSGIHYVELEEYFGFTKASVCKAVLTLKEDGYVEIDRFYCILLTEKGSEEAKKIYHKYLFFVKLLSEAGVEEQKAKEEACRLEHGISYESLITLIRNEKLEVNNRTELM